MMSLKIRWIVFAGLATVALLTLTSGAQADPVVTDGLVASYEFSGNANDSSGNGHHGLNHGAMPAEDRFGNRDQAFLFDGNDYIDTGSTMAGLVDFSISVWIKTTQTEQKVLRHDDPAIIGTYQRRGLTSDFVITNYNGIFAWYDELCRNACSGSPHNDYSTGVFIADNSWRHLAVTREREDLTY